MRVNYSTGEVFFDNEHHCGNVVYDNGWKTYRFRPVNETQTFSEGQLYDLSCILHKLNKSTKKGW